MKNFLCALLVLFIAQSAFCKENKIEGIWTTIDDDTKQARSLVEILSFMIRSCTEKSSNCFLKREILKI